MSLDLSPFIELQRRAAALICAHAVEQMALDFILVELCRARGRLHRNELLLQNYPGGGVPDVIYWGKNEL